MSRPPPNPNRAARPLQLGLALASLRARWVPHAFSPKTIKTALALLLCSLISACGTTPPGEGLLDKTLGLVGLQKAEAPVAAPPASSAESLKALLGPTKMALRIHASDQLNSGATNRPLSLVVKVYKLKGSEAFLLAPYKSFSEAPFAHEEVLSSRELVLLPGQRYEVEESLSKDVSHLGVVALFKSPEAQRWRFVFDVARNAKDGVTLGAHQCAFSVSQGETIGSPPEVKRLAGTVCR